MKEIKAVDDQRKTSPERVPLIPLLVLHLLLERQAHERVAHGEDLVHFSVGAVVLEAGCDGGGREGGRTRERKGGKGREREEEREREGGREGEGRVEERKEGKGGREKSLANALNLVITRIRTTKTRASSLPSIAGRSQQGPRRGCARSR